MLSRDAAGGFGGELQDRPTAVQSPRLFSLPAQEGAWEVCDASGPQRRLAEGASNAGPYADDSASLFVPARLSVGVSRCGESRFLSAASGDRPDRWHDRGRIELWPVER